MTMRESELEKEKFKIVEAADSGDGAENPEKGRGKTFSQEELSEFDQIIHSTDWPKASVSSVVEKLTPVIQELSPGLLLRMQINAEVIEDTLKKLYPDQENFDDACRSFKFWLGQFALISNIREQERQSGEKEQRVFEDLDDEIEEALENLREILGGKFNVHKYDIEAAESIGIFRANPFPTAIEFEPSFSKTVMDNERLKLGIKSYLGFVDEGRQQKIYLEVLSTGNSPEPRLAKIKQIAEQYYKECSDLATKDKNKPIPSYYDPRMVEIIEELRKDILI